MSGYVVLGLANCFIRNDENQLEPIQVVEPVPSAAFLTLLKRSPSSYSVLKAFQAEDVLRLIESGATSLGFPKEAMLASDFHERLEASIRTYEHKPEAATQLPSGQTIQLDNLSPHKRILNPKRSVKATDNVKQHSHAMKTL